MLFLWLLAAFAAAALIALALCRVIMAVGFKDAPTDARKAEVHQTPTPTAGGVGVGIAAIASAYAATTFAGVPISPVVLVAAGASLAAMALGLSDDKLELAASLKLAIMLGVCIAMAALGVRADVLQPAPGVLVALPVIIGAAGSVLWLVVVINAVNFMDGANGLAMSMAAVAAIGLSACAIAAGAWDVAILSAALAGALGGFLVWNLSGRLFVGDAGALLAGAMLGGLSLVLVKLRPDWLFVPPTLLLPFLSDVLLTLAWRAKHKKPLFSAHRDHAYQIAMKAGLKHWQVTAIHAFWAFNAAALGFIGALAGGWAPSMVFLVLLVVSCWLHLWVRHAGVKGGLVGANVP